MDPRPVGVGGGVSRILAEGLGQALQGPRHVAGVEQLDEPGVAIDRTRDSWLDLAEIDLTNPVTWCRNNQIPVQPR